MKNAIPANNTALPDRRRLLTAGAAAVAVVSAAASIAVASSAPQIAQDDLAISLWEKRMAMKPLFIAAYREQREAEDRLPWWAKSGPSMLCHDGTFTGPIVGWPAIQDMELPDRPGVYKLVRPGKDDPWRFNGLSGEWREKAIQQERDALAKRRKAQRSEKRRAGVLAANWALEALFKQLDAVDDEIEGLSSSTPNATAVLVLREALFQAHTDDTIDGSGEFLVALKALEFLRPHLRGIVKEHVDDLFENPDMPVKWCKAYLYEEREGQENSGKQAA